MTEEIKIIDAVPEDALGITNVFYKAWLATYPNKEIGVTVEDIEDSYKDEFSTEKIENLKQIIRDVPQTTKRLVAKMGNEIVGAGTFIKRDEYNHLRTLYVLPEFQHKGIGTMFWNEARKFFDPNKDTIVQVAEYTENAINFYKKLGFVDTGKRTTQESEKLKSGAVIVDMQMIIKRNEKPMEYVYHRVPKNMSGTVLYPLNTLKDTKPDIYIEQSKKYVGRERILGAKIPPLNCLWNDVLHFTAVEPHTMKETLEKAGFVFEPSSYFKIPVEMIFGENSIAFTNPEGKPTLVPLLNYETFDIDRMPIYREIPVATLEYYKEKKLAGENPLVYQFVPHILYKGSVDIKGLDVVTS